MVWKDWNEDGEFVTYTVPPGKPLKVWEGLTAKQVKEGAPEFSLEGGAIQIVVDPTQLKKGFTGQRQKTGWGYGAEEGESIKDIIGLDQALTARRVSRVLLTSGCGCRCPEPTRAATGTFL